MRRDNEHFTAHEIDEQVEQFAQASMEQPLTPSRRVVQNLQRVYAVQAGQEAQSLERIRERLKARSSGDKEFFSEGISLPLSENEPVLAAPAQRAHRFGALVQSFAAVLIVVVLLGGFLVLFASRSTRPIGSGSSSSSSGASWHVVQSLNPGSLANSLFAATALSVNDVWAVGSFSNSSNDFGVAQTLIEHWNGGQWSVIPSPSPGSKNNELTDVAAVSTTDVWAVGDASSSNFGGHTLIEHWNGAQWSVVPSPNPGFFQIGLTAVTAVSVDDVWAVGFSASSKSSVEHTLIEHWNGVQWSIVSSPNADSPQSFLNKVTAISASGIWAVGSSSDSSGLPLRTLIEHWNGTQWSIVSSPNVGSAQNDLYSVTAVSAGDIWAVGYSSDSKKASGPTLIEHWNGTQWRVVQSPSTGAAQNLLNAVVAVRGNDVWSVGFSGDSNTSRTLIEHWNGTQWSIVSSPNPGSPQNNLSGLALVPHSTRVWAVGFAGNVIGSSETITEFYA